MNYLISRSLPEPDHMLDPPEAFQADISVEESEQQRIDREEALIDLLLD